MSTAADGTATITCDDGSSAVVPAGTDGADCTVEEDDGTKTIRCEDGTEVVVHDGEPGAPGDAGAAGDVGAPGSSGQDARIVGDGLKVTIDGASIPTDRRAIVTLHMSDAADRPLDATGTLTEGSVTIRWILARLEDGPGGVGQYTPYLTTVATSMSGVMGTQGSSESTGTLGEVAGVPGAYTYRFELVLPEGYDATRTHTIAAYATRTFEGVQYVANPIFHFRPDGMAVTDTREIVTTEGCNSCHDTLTAHGGARREVGLCILCHTPGTTDPDTGASLAMPEMVHKIHMGARLPSVVDGTPYQIIGFRGAVHDYSTVRTPQSVEDCANCHVGEDGDRWETNPTRASCGACHDRTSFEEDAPDDVAHRGGPRSDDSTCAVCHTPAGGIAGIADVHLTPDRDPASPVVGLAITSVTSTAPTSRAVVEFTATVDGVGRDIVTSPFTSMRLTVAGPSTDYAGFVQFNPMSQGTLAAIDASAGRFRYTLPDTMEEIAADIGTEAEGTWGFGFEAYLQPVTNGPRYAPVNPVHFAAVTGEVAPRRTIVALEQCNGCHADLNAHGGSRRNTDYCAMCHTANLDTIGRMPLPASGETATTTSVRLSTMIHSIHRGEERESSFVVYDRSGASIDFDEVGYPGDLRDCGTCHADGSYELPLGPALASRTSEIDATRTRVTNSVRQATDAACSGCHDGEATTAHAESMTTAMGVESCAVCHSGDGPYSVDVVHARPGL